MKCWTARLAMVASCWTWPVCGPPSAGSWPRTPARSSPRGAPGRGEPMHWTATRSAPTDVDWALVRDRVLRHADGVAVGSTVAALAERGVLEFLLDAREATLGEIRRRFGGNPGYLQVALRLLANQGWVVGGGASGTDGFGVNVTRAGHTALGLATRYQTAAAVLPIAGMLGEL